MSTSALQKSVADNLKGFFQLYAFKNPKIIFLPTPCCFFFPAQHPPKQRTTPAVRCAVRCADDWHETWWWPWWLGRYLFLLEKRRRSISES